MKREIISACIAVVGAGLIAGCQKQDKPSTAGPSEISLETSLGNYTKAMQGDFGEGDTFGLYIIQWNGESQPEFAGDNIYKDNLLCTKNADGVSMTKTYYPSNKLDFYAYYPYTSEGGSYYEPQKISHTIAKDQSQEVYFNQSDFLRATVAEVEESENPVHLSFSHCMSLIDVQLVPGEGMALDDLKNARMLVLDRPTMCDVDLVTGEVVAGQWNHSDIIPYGNKVSVADGKASMMSCISVPGVLPAGDKLFEIKIKERIFNYIPQEDIELKPGYRYLFEIAVNAAQMPTMARVTESLR